jgi:hypothetical protein
MMELPDWLADRPLPEHLRGVKGIEGPSPAELAAIAAADAQELHVRRLAALETMAGAHWRLQAIARRETEIAKAKREAEHAEWVRRLKARHAETVAAMQEKAPLRRG